MEPIIRHWVWLLLVWCAAGDIAPAFAAPGDCQVVRAPGKFESKGESAETAATPGNRGIVPPGFVALADGTSVVHGIDVSKWQSSADFIRVVECGGRFAYVRLSAGRNPDNELEYRSHWANARSVRLLVGPYHNLTLVDPSPIFASLANRDQQRVVEQNVASAREQASLLMQRLREVLLLDPLPPDGSTGMLGLAYLPIVLDASARPQMNGSAADRKVFGMAYRAAICTWMTAIRSTWTFNNQPIMLFTLPTVYAEYDLNALPCMTSDAPIWISHRDDDGRRALDDPRPEMRSAITALCKPNGSTDRCLFEQYTSWGGFALFQKDEGLDLNRFFGTEEQLRALLQHANRR